MVIYGVLMGKACMVFGHLYRITAGRDGKNTFSLLTVPYAGSPVRNDVDLVWKILMLHLSCLVEPCTGRCE